MEDKYSYQFVGEALTGFVDAITKPELFQKLEVRLSGEFSKYPLRDGIRLAGMIQSDPNSEETVALEDKIARHLLLKLSVTFWQDERQVGQLATITDPGQSLETDSFLQENPMFYHLILNIATGHVLKNFTAPLKSIPGTPAR